MRRTKKIRYQTIYCAYQNVVSHNRILANITPSEDSILDVTYIANHPTMQAALAQPSRSELYYPLPSEELEDQIRQRDNHTCQICGLPGEDVDHIVPLEISHNNDPSNLRVLCRVCNLQRGRHCWHKAKEQPVQLGFGVQL